jgi:SpoVK/Ycf46/Vps4 family AAA+-type ATPase
VELTRGYSGADLKSLSAEAAMIPLRSIENIVDVDVSNIRPLVINDFKEAILNVKATVRQSDLSRFVEWNDKYGSFPMKEEDIQVD